MLDKMNAAILIGSGADTRASAASMTSLTILKKALPVYQYHLGCSPGALSRTFMQTHHMRLLFVRSSLPS